MYEKLRELAEQHELTMYQLSKATGISQSVLSNLKIRGGFLSAENLKKLADYFGVPIEYFLQ